MAIGKDDACNLGPPDLVESANLFQKCHQQRQRLVFICNPGLCRPAPRHNGPVSAPHPLCFSGHPCTVRQQSSARPHRLGLQLCKYAQYQAYMRFGAWGGREVCGNAAHLHIVCARFPNRPRCVSHALRAGDSKHRDIQAILKADLLC